MEHVTSTDGFALGLAFHADKALFICDLKHAAVFRFDLTTRFETIYNTGHQNTKLSVGRYKAWPIVCVRRTHLVRRDPGSGLMIWRLEKAHFGSRTI